MRALGKKKNKVRIFTGGHEQSAEDGKKCGLVGKKVYLPDKSDQVTGRRTVNVVPFTFNVASALRADLRRGRGRRQKNSG
jgi:hypothetical protein